MTEINNIINKDAKVAFVLESPYVDEVFHGYPLAGESGREMAKYLLNRYDVPFGLIVKEKAIRCCLNIIFKNEVSILNISKSPFMSEALLKNKMEPQEDIEEMTKLKGLLEKNADYNTKHRAEELNKLKNKIYNSFKAECKNSLNKKTLLIPCGRIARTFCIKLLEDLANLDINIIDCEIPHPSRSGWSKLNSNALEKIKAAIFK